ncbi:hypothetical protein ABD68_12450 [Bacillus endophyticus]|uniref:hypothetical protein n=1 Tax=Priestia endophytica TaxID=135735 RepID=UPI0018CCEF9C|nr:hypothetical protein [Priestia endophytica]MBG9812376.1 hypothetical protein [Priestia endophytica]
MFNKIGKKEKEITYRDTDSGVREALIGAKNHSNSPYEQFLWLKNNKELSSQQSTIGMVELAQMNFNVHKGETIHLNDGEVDYLMRGLGDALRHMQEDLPEGVWHYIKSHIEDSLEHAIKQSTKKASNTD